MHVPAVGVFLLGVVISYMVWYFIVRFATDRFTAAALTAVVGVLTGGVVAAFLESDAAGRNDRWWYPIGLFVGSLVFLVGRTFETGEIPGLPRVKRKRDKH